MIWTPFVVGSEVLCLNCKLHIGVYADTPAHVIAYGIGMSDKDLVAVLLLFGRGTMEVPPKGCLNVRTILEERLQRQDSTRAKKHTVYCSARPLCTAVHAPYVLQCTPPMYCSARPLCTAVHAPYVLQRMPPMYCSARTAVHAPSGPLCRPKYCTISLYTAVYCKTRALCSVGLTCWL